METGWSLWFHECQTSSGFTERPCCMRNKVESDKAGPDAYRWPLPWLHVCKHSCPNMHSCTHMNLMVIKPHANFIVFLHYGILTHVFRASSLGVLLSISLLVYLLSHLGEEERDRYEATIWAGKKTHNLKCMLQWKESWCNSFSFPWYKKAVFTFLTAYTLLKCVLLTTYCIF